MMDREKLQAAVDAKWIPVYASSYGDVREELKEKYGERRWIGKMAEALSGRQAGVKAKEDKPYLAARRSIERYEKGQFKDMKKYSKEMERVGKSLPPIGKKLPGNQLTLTVKGTQYEKGGDREREWTATFKGPDAYAFANSPSYQTFFQQGFSYPADLVAEGKGFDGGDSSALNVTSVA